MNYYLPLAGFCLLVGLSLHAQPTSETFSTPGTYSWTVPAGYTANVTVEAWGGGGGGGNGANQEAGGGGGAYASSIMELTPGDYSITVGSGGTQGNPGQSSLFESSVIALGGSSGSGNSGFAGGSGAGSTGDNTFSGGTGGNAIGCFFSDGGGGGGDSGGPASNGNPGGNAFCVGVIAFGGLSGFGAGVGGNGGAGEGFFASGGNGNVPGGGGGGRGSAAGVSGFGASGQVAITVNVILPIELLSFTATDTENGVELDWTTVSEIDNNYMAVEHSVDGASFREIGRIEGQGTSYDIHHYQFVDKLAAAGRNFYRLRQVDFDETTTYHKIISVLHEGKENDLTLAVYPNPSRDELNLRWTASSEEGEAHWRLYNLSGQLVLEGSADAVQATERLPIAQLPAGTYWVRLIVDDRVTGVRFEKIE